MAAGKQLVRGKSGMKMICMAESDRSPFLMEEPPWEDDNMFPNCVKCDRKFDFTHRRHHCRRCGKVFCGTCCGQKVMLPRMSFVDPVRVCNECSKIARKEEEFFDKHLKILCNGGCFIVDDTYPLKFTCKLDNKAHQSILFECGEQADHEPVKLEKIISVQLVSDKEGNLVTGITLKYKQGDEVLQVMLQAIPEPESDRKRALVWLVSLQRAIKMVFEVNN